MPPKAKRIPQAAHGSYAKHQFDSPAPNGVPHIKPSTFKPRLDADNRIIPGQRWTDVASITFQIPDKTEDKGKSYDTHHVCFVRVEARLFKNGNVEPAIEFRFVESDLAKVSDDDFDKTLPPPIRIVDGDNSPCDDFTSKGWNWTGQKGELVERSNTSVTADSRAAHIRMIWNQMYPQGPDYAYDPSGRRVV